MNNFSFIIIAILISLLTSCSKDFELDDYLDHSSSFAITVRETDEESRLSEYKSKEFSMDSEIGIRLKEWGAHNMDGWHKSPASHIGDVYVSQGDFTLIYTRDSGGVVVSFINEEGKAQQYIKSIPKGELNFLFDTL